MQLLVRTHEHHLRIDPWGSNAKALDKPDRLIFDLDPGDNTGWNDLVAAALEVRARLADDKLESFVKTSGGKCLHVVAPLTPRAGWDRYRPSRWSGTKREAERREPSSGITCAPIWWSGKRLS